MSRSGARKIVHVDMDAFFASVEIRDRRELRGKPVIVGGDPRSRAVVCSASYEARRFGVRSAMSCAQAARLCPGAVFLAPAFEKYVAASREIHEVFSEASPCVEGLSLDEAFLDVTENKLGLTLARDVAHWVKREIRERTGLTASAGVGPNKLVAKIASDYRKPDGFTVVPPERAQAFLDPLPVARLWGVGPVTAGKLDRVGIRTIRDLRVRDEAELTRELGSWAMGLRELAMGRDDREVSPERESKSTGAETTFERDLLELGALLETLGELSREVASSLRADDRMAWTVTLKVKYANFEQITRSRTLPNPVRAASAIAREAGALLLASTEAGRRPIRLLGVSASRFVDPGDPLQLWFEFEEGRS